MTWPVGRLAGFDLETTGTDPLTDRIVSAAVVVVRAQRGQTPADDPARWLAVERWQWLAYPEADIPAEATAIHQITTEHARAFGRPAAKVVHELACVLAELIEQGVPLAIMNAPYDLTLLDRELWRHQRPSLALRAGREPLVLDPQVMDRHVDRGRAGPRNLGALCTHYGVRLDGAHQAAADALAAARLTVAIADEHPELASMPLAELHRLQRSWAGGQANARAARYAREGRPTAGIHRQWPMIPRLAEGSDQ